MGIGHVQGGTRVPPDHPEGGGTVGLYSIPYGKHRRAVLAISRRLMMLVAAPLEIQLGQRVRERGLNQGDLIWRDLLLQASFSAGAGVFGLLLIDRRRIRRKDREDGHALSRDFCATASNQHAILLIASPGDDLAVPQQGYQ